MGTHSLFPILSTSDLPRLVAFYEGALGAVVAYRFTTEGEDDYVSLQFGPATIGIGRDPGAPPVSDRIALWFYVDDVDAAASAWAAAGGAILRPPTDMPWGERVAQGRDADGNLVNLAALPGDSPS